jgi:hypothetical protein
MSAAPPLRFLVLVVGGWTCLRVAMLVPWSQESGAADAVRPRPASSSAAAVTAPEPPPPPSFRIVSIAAEPAHLEIAGAAVTTQPIPPPQAAAAWPAPVAAPAVPWPGARASPILRQAAPNRWSASAWLLVRGDDAPSLAAGGTLGGSQTGFRILYRLNRDAARPLQVSARISAPLRNRAGTEAALGLDWRPVAGLPVHILAERRQAMGRDGRSAFALMLHGGVSERLPGGFRLDAYGQAGVVGARSRDLFADGGARLGVAVGDIEVGAALSGGAQPGLARLDAGPQVTLRLPMAGESLRLTAEWRFRIAGDAQPDSGPALTLAGDF